jgi:hypothetical protein
MRISRSMTERRISLVPCNFKRYTALDAGRESGAAAKPPERAENRVFRRSGLNTENEVFRVTSYQAHRYRNIRQADSDSNSNPPGAKHRRMFSRSEMWLFI